MNNNTKTFALATGLALATFLVACNDNNTAKENSRDFVDNTKEAVGDAAAATKEATKEAWNSFSGYTVDKKDQAVNFLEKQADNLDDQIDVLKDKAGEATGATKQKYQAAVNTLGEKRRDLALQIDKTKNATEETWDDVKNETQEKWNDFTEYLQEVRNDLKS